MGGLGFSDKSKQTRDFVRTPAGDWSVYVCLSRSMQQAVQREIPNPPECRNSVLENPTKTEKSDTPPLCVFIY